MAYFILGERMKLFDQVALLFVFASVAMVILGA
jgi:drug/metabolite transporter (DMT)-like permease